MVVLISIPVLRFDEGDGDEELQVITEGKNSPDQRALNPTMTKKSIKNKSSGNGSSVTHKTFKSPTASKSDDKRLVFIPGDSIVQHLHGELLDAKQRGGGAVKSFTGSETEVWLIT